MLCIRRAEKEEMPEIESVYQCARAFMAANGNPNQWGLTNPSAQVLLSHIDRGELYVLEQAGKIVGAFAFIPGEDPTYGYIEGQWHSDGPYAAIHCVAGNGSTRGIFAALLEYCGKRCRYLRIDTHKDNTVMQHILEKQGFAYCGIIYLANGSPRMAYDRIR